MIRTLLTSVFLLGLCAASDAQERYVVHFDHKLHTPFSLDTPEAYLSDRALERRQRQNIPIDSLDLPVDPNYVQTIRDLGIPVYFTSKWFNAAIIQTTADRISELEQLSFVDSVEFAGNDQLLTPGNENVSFEGPAIPTTNPQSLSTEYQNSVLGIDDMNTAGYTGEGMLIAITDGGFTASNRLEALSHLRLDNKIVDTYDFIRNETDVYGYDDHGTSVLSLMAAREGNFLQGSVPDAQYALYIMEYVPTEYRIEEYSWVLAAERADSLGADLINASLGYSNFFNDPAMDYVPDDMDGETTVIAKGANVAAEKGLQVVAAAGNSGFEPPGLWPYISSPADAAGTMAVGSVGTSLSRSGFSSIGLENDGTFKPDVLSIGDAPVGLRQTGEVSLLQGTSFSAPQICGLMAGLWQANRQLTNTELLNQVKKTANNANAPNDEEGWGIPDFTRANEDIVLGLNDPEEIRLRVYPIPVRGESLVVESDGLSLDNAVLHWTSMDGRTYSAVVLSRNPQRLVLSTRSMVGVYVLQVKTSTYKRVFKVIVN